MSLARGTLRDALALPSYRGWALVSAAVLTGTYLAALYHVVDVVGGLGGVGVFALEVIAAIALAAALSRALSVRWAVAIGGLLLVGGLGVYLATVPQAYVDVIRQIQDTISLLTGLSVLRMTNAGVWALGFTPGPLFASWYLFLRREYDLGVVVGGAALSFFLLTGDVDAVWGVVGVLGAAGTIGFGRLDIEGGSGPQRNTVIALIVAMLVVATSISLVPGGQAQPLLANRGAGTVEGSLVDTENRVSVLGSIRLSPEVRFTVTAEEGTYWRVGAYDRYTGSDWVRTGETRPYGGRLPPPEGERLRRVRQTFQAESSIGVMPAAWKPVRVGVGADRTLVTSMGGLQPRGSLDAGDQYSVESFRNDPSVAQLRAAGSEYPAAIEERYLQLPESTPDRVERFTADLTANANNAYDTAAIIERWLERNKRYSLQVDKPDGDIASSFLFGMDAGYCVYFATTMVAMLRSQGIPARFVVGYTTGQRVAENQWVVRGYNSHAWVEVYFPEHGWVRFDPTPAAPRRAAERARLQQARAADATNVDTDQTRNASLPTPATVTATGPTPATVNGTVGGANTSGAPQLGAQVGGVATGTAPGASGDGGIGLPSRETMAYGLILFAGAVTAFHRSGLFERGYRELWLRRSPTGEPAERVTGAFDRLEYLLERRYRPRRAQETPQEYVEALRGEGIDDRALRVYDLYERARYAGSVSEADAEAACRLLADLVDERSPWGGGSP